MKRKTAALYNPFLDTLGGGEKHILSILKVFDETDYDITIFWNDNLQNAIENKFSLTFRQKIQFFPNIFKSASFFQKQKSLKQFDVFFYVTDGSYFLSSAKKNYIFCMVPDRNLYRLNWLNRIKTANFEFICNSYYTQTWLKRWKIDATVIYPYVADEFINQKINISNKEKIILSVGRFFTQLHAKKQSEIIDVFNKLKQKNSMYKNFKLILAGGLKEEDMTYFKYLRNKIKNQNDIVLIANPSFDKLIDLYKKARFFWHFTGYGVDERQTPQLAEHLGITPLEAMTSGCLTYCFNAGGPKEIIKDRVNGFLFNNDEELVSKMNDANKSSAVVKQAKDYVVKNFSYPVFKNNVRNCFKI